MAKNPFDQFDQPANAFDQFDNQPEPAKPASAARKLGDLGLSLAKGVVAVPEAAVGLADLVSGGRAGKAAEDIGIRFKDAKDVLSSFQSDDFKGKQQEFQQADGLLDKAGVAVSNPSLIANAVAEFVPPMGAGGVGARGVLAMAPKVGAVGAGAIGEGLAGAGSAAEGIRQETNDGLLTGKQAALAGASGAATAAFGAAGGKAAKALGIGDVDTMIARGATDVAQTAAQANKGVIRRGAEGFLSEGVLEELPQSLSEQILQNEALGKPWQEGLDEAAVMAVLTGGAMGAGAGSLTGRQTQPVVPPPPPPPGPDLSLDPGQLAAVQSEEMGAPNVPQTTPPDGRAALNAQQEQQRQQREAQLAAQRAVSSPDDEIFASTGALDPQQQAKAAILATVPQGQAPGVLARTAIAALDSGQTQEIEFSQAEAQEQAAYEQAMAAQEQQAAEQDTADQSITDPNSKANVAQMSEEDKRAVLFSNQAVADGGRKWTGTQDGDILNGMAAPFATRMAAARRANMEGKDWTIAPVFDGWVARRKDAFNVSDTTGVQPAPTASSGNDGNNAGTGVESGATDGNGLGADTGGREADTLVQPGESSGGVDAAPAANDPQAEAAPDQAPEAARTNSTTKGNEDGTQAAQAQPQQTQPEAGANTSIPEPAAGEGVAGPTEAVAAEPEWWKSLTGAQRVFRLKASGINGTAMTPWNRIPAESQSALSAQWGPKNPVWKSDSFAPVGKRAFEAGKPRVLPKELQGLKNNAIALEWYSGWDSANAAAPVTQKPEIVVDKAEMRPYRKPDGSAGYEAVPIENAAPTAEKPGTVNVPPPVAEAFAAQMQKQKGRITRLKNEADKAGSLEDKRAAQLKVTAAEATLRQMRLKIFDAEDAAIKAVVEGSTKAFADYADLFPSAAEEIAKLTGQNDELDAEMQSYEDKASGKDITAEIESAVRRLRDAKASGRQDTIDLVESQIRALRQETKAPEPARDSAGNVIQRPKLKGEDRFQYPQPMRNDDPAKTAAQARVVDYMNGDIDRPTLIKALEDSGLEQGTMFAITQRLQDDGFSMGEMDRLLDRREKSAKPKKEPKAPAAQETRAPAATETVATPDAKTALSEREKAAKAKMFNALGKLAALAGKNTRMNWTQEEEQQLLPIVIELFDGAMELGAVSFQQAVAYVRDFIGSNLDQETADAIPFDTLQGAYISVAGRHKDKPVTSKKEVVGFESLEELNQSAPDAVNLDSLEKPAEIADTGTEETTTAEDTAKESLLGANDDTRRNATNDSEPLDPILSEPNPEDGAGGSVETGPSLRAPDAQGNGRPKSGGPGRGNSLDGSKKPVLPSTPAEIRPLADGPVGKTEDRPQQLSGENPGNFVITDEFKLGQGTDGDKISGNLNAIRTLRKLQQENRYPTKAEQAIMARYVGWGGLKTVFDPKKADATDQYGKAQRELKTLLSPDEYRAANGSIRNAHYTAEGIVDGMWRVMRFMGFKGGRALEPTIGIGNFVGRMPADMAASTEWHASELDTTTGQLAAMLYPEANILASTGFQDAPFADGAFDISVGNPPFGLQTITDKSPNRKHLNGQKIHNYIIAKAGMHLRPGGVMSMVVTHRFLDTANPEARDVLAKDFRFLGAFRLPNDAFKKNAGTDVVTDVVFLQKLGAEEKRERDASWLDVNGSITVDDQAMRVNRYYQDNPTHILGRSAMDGSMQRTGEAEYTVHSDGRDIGKAIDELMQTGFKHMAGVLEQSNNSKALAPAMLTQSDLPIGGVMVNDEGKIIRRELNDANGNAVVQELTPETLWKDQAADWQALHNAVLDIKAAAKAGKVTQEDANEVLALSRFLFKADGTPFDKPNKAVEAVYKLVEELAKPAKFQWTHDGSLLLIVGALNRKQLGEDGYKSLKGMLDLRNRTLRLIHAEQAGDSKMEEYRADLNKAYDAFVKENGYLSDSKNANLLEGDVGAEAGIEASYVPAISPAVAKSSGMPARAASAKKSDIMTRRVNFPYKEITHADSAPDALFASISEHGKVDLPYMAKITNKSVQSVIEELTSGDNPQLFRDPETGDYQEAERYLSGNVKHKLKLAKEKGLKSNIQALEKALPVDKTKDQVKPNIRGMWMPPEIFTEFLQTIGYEDARISAIASQGILQASGETLAMTDFGIQFRHGKRTPLDMFNSQASGKPIIISVTSNGKTYKDEQGTKEVNALAERMGKVFQEWAYSDDDRVKRIVEAFNQNMNTHSPRTFDGVKYLKPVGANPSIVMRRTQLDGAWRMMQEKTMLADHVVGAGKTFTLIMGIMERRRMGLSRKPMVVVPNHLVTQWARDFYKLYPGAKVLAANPADFAKKNRRRLLARIATGDYDAVIVGHTSIGFMETPTEDLKAIVDEKLEGLKEALAEARLSGESKRTLGQIEDRIDRYEERLKDLAARPTDDIGIDFKALGIDHLSVDEAHEFKNLEYSTSGDRVVGMNDPNGSKKAFDLYSKVRGLLSRGGGVTFATGTPVSNSLVEIYTMMSYLAHDELVLRGQEHFDSWSGAYAATETRLEYTATQKLKPRRVLAGLNNLSALRQLYEQFADIITMSDLKRIYTEEMVAKNLRDGTNLNTEFPVPKVANGKRELITGDITPAQKEYMDYLVARMGQIEANKSDKEYMRIDNALNVLTDARKMSLDIRIVDPSAKRDENGKVATAAKNIKATYDKWDADRGTQLVFCDLSTPAKTAAKEARSIISATIEQLFGKDLSKQVKKQLEGKTFEQQWKLLTEKSEEISDNPDTSEEKRDAIAEFMGKIEDPEATMNVADIGFSVYDDLKSVLMDSGIPESEIAFIHDYNTPDQKEKLFDRVNNGYVRVLIGSSMKMGAGTNAQRRLVALHHMDAPWRPSDVEQREGRIIRQGNMLYERDPDGFEVEIKAYSTNQTSDTVMWQILQRKAGAIEQFREGGLDSMEEEGGDSDQYAEFMATSTGNPVFRQKLEAERRLTEIESEIGGALIVRSNANSFLESYDRRRKAAKTRQEALESFDASTASYGGESGTQAEFEAAMKVANDDYLAKYAVWTQKNAAADLAIAKWETEPEIMRGDKPSKPMMPSQPDLYTKSVQAVSGYARAIGMALNEAAIDKNTKVTMATGSLIVTGQTMTSGPYWTVYANNMGENFSLDSSGAQKASASTRIIQALTPFSLSNELNTKARQYAREIGELDTEKTEALKGSKLEVDTTARDAARVELRWFTAQVAFAEVQADIDRGATKNRYIERDKRRNISQNQAKALTEPVKHTIDGVKYTTTGLNAHSGYEAIAQATRDSDGVSAYIVAQQNKEKITYAVAVQPAKLRKTEASTNLKQTGAPEANTSDVVFSRPVFSRGAQTQANKSVEAIAMAIASKWEGSPEIVVAFDMNDPRIDEKVRKEDQRQRSGGATGTPEGFYYKGTVYLMSSKLGTPNDIARVLFHEALGHYGLRGTFGKALRPILRDVAMLRRAEVDAKIKQYGLKMGNTLDRFTAAEEVLAELAQTKPEIGFVQRAIAAIRTWLRQNVPGFNNLRLTDAELIRNYILPARAFVEQGGGPKGGLPVRVEPTFSRGTNDAMTNNDVVGNQGGRSADDTTPGAGIKKPMTVNPKTLVFRESDQNRKDELTGETDDFDPIVVIDDGVQLSILDGHNRASVAIDRGDSIEAVKVTQAEYDRLQERGFDDGEIAWAALQRSGQSYAAGNLESQFPGSAISNGGDKAWDDLIENEPTAPDSGGAMFSRTIGETLTTAANNVHDVTLPAGYTVGDMLKSAPGKLNWWHKTVGTMYNLAERSPAFKRVFDGAQSFINDVSYFATEAADLAPTILPKLETWKDIAKSPLSPEDTKAISAPIFEGTLTWARDESGKPIKMVDLEAQAAALTPEQKAQRLLRNNKVSDQVLKMWQGLPIEQFESIINGKYERDMLKAGVVWKDSELKGMFNLTDKQIPLYREFRKATDKSLTNLAISDMLRFGGKDTAPISDEVLAAKSVTEASEVLRDYLLRLAEFDPERETVLIDTANKMIDKGTKAQDLIGRGYAPLSRYGQDTLDVVSAEGERVYFSMFESRMDAARARRNMEQEYPGATITQGTVSEEEYKLFSGVSPETLELFGDMLGLEAQGDSASAQAFQTYLKLAKSNRSSMKRLIQRKGIAGFNEDAGRVLAGFVYSNARQTSSNLHMGSLSDAANTVAKQQGELKDQAVRLVDYIKNPREEAQALRWLLFAQYIGGSVASAMVNMTQPLTMTFPWLSQYGGVTTAAKQMAAAVKDSNKKLTGDARLDAALKRAEEDGTVSPQEVHQLLQQSQGKGALQSGDGTKLGNAAAAANNTLSRISLGWGKLFSLAEQFNRRVTFIAAYRTAVAQGMKDPDGFARKAIVETQGIYCVDDQTECLTAAGWKTHAQMQAGETVYAVDESGALVESQLLDVHRFNGSIAATEFKNANGVSMVLTADHTCLVQNYNSRDKKYQRVMRVKAKDVKTGHHFLRVPLSDATERTAVYSDDEVMLFAWIAAEGHLFAHRGVKEKRGVGLVQSETHNPKYVAEIDALLDRLGGHYNRKVSGSSRKDTMVCWQLRKPLWLKVHEALPEKLIGFDLLGKLTIPQMRIFLDTFVKGDGHIPAQGGPTITQKEVGNLDVLQAMAVLTGQTSTVYHRMGENDFGALYIALNSKRAYRKEMTADPVSLNMAWCPETVHGTWIARRNGRTFVTGNSKGNKPAWARGAVGSTLFTFKQYSISYMEMLHRMATQGGPEGKKAALLALGVLFLLGGAGGFPGADDLDDLISGILQRLGYNFDSKQRRKEFFAGIVGEGGAQFLERGISGLPGVPLDVSGRMGMGNLLPGTGLFTKKTDYTRDVAEIAGPAGDFVKRGFNAAGKVLEGNIGGASGAVSTLAPKAVQNLYQAYDMANMGMYRDAKGMKVLDTDGGDAVLKAIGFQPNDVKKVQDASFDAQRMIGLNKLRETEIANRWAQGIFEKDTDKVKAAREELAEWNATNADSPIRINFKQILQRVQKMNQSKAERIAATAPKEIRADVRRALEVQ